MGPHTDIKQLLKRDTYEALINANAPDGVNHFATMADLGALPGVMMVAQNQVCLAGIAGISLVGFTVPANIPELNSKIFITINGINYHVGDQTTDAPLFFGPDAVTPRSLGAVPANRIIAGDNLYWNSAFSGFGGEGFVLTVNDRFDLAYFT